MVVIQEGFGIYTQVWWCFKGNTQQIIAKTLKKFIFTLNHV